MTSLFGTAQKLVTEQVNRGITIDDVDTLVIPLDGNETLTFDFLVEQALTRSCLTALPPKYSIRQLNDGLIQLPVSSQAEVSDTHSMLYIPLTGLCIRTQPKLQFLNAASKVAKD